MTVKNAGRKQTRRGVRLTHWLLVWVALVLLVAAWAGWVAVLMMLPV